MKKATPLFTKTSKTIASNVHTLAKNSDMTAAEFAAATKLSRSTIRRIEDARRFKRPYNPQLSTLLKLSKAANLSLDELAGSRLN
ncbi:MAG TPA: helix-turn-helix transcriptional regulator [Methanosarcina sp.]|nr:helix-turn-helix transcriptional regulator [Methanosarcina sp.]